MKINISTLAISFAALFGAALPAHATVFISDNFTTGGPGRAVGDVLFGTTTPVGGVLWKGGAGDESSPTFRADNSVGFNVNPGLATASSAFVPLAILGSTTNMTLTLSADVQPIGSSWIALEFSAQGDVTFQASLSAIWSANGSYTIFKNDFSNPVLASGNAAVDPLALNSYALSYNTGTDTVSLVLNGTTVVDNVAVGGFSAGANALDFGGFSLFNPLAESTTTQLDNFEVSMVPEPSSAALIGLGLASLLVRFRRVTR